MTNWTPPRGTVAIIGAGPGLGAALARRFGANGNPVGLVARGGDRLAGLVNGLRDAGVTAAGFPADVAHEPSLRLAIDGIADRFGPVAVLIHNVSLNLAGPPSGVAPDDVLVGFRAGVLAAVIALQQVRPGMSAAGTGTIMITGGGLALNPSPGAPALSIQKAAVRAYAIAAAKELAPAGIHVATVTIMGTIAPDTAFDPDLIAAEFWRVHEQPPELWEAETQFRGQATG